MFSFSHFQHVAENHKCKLANLWNSGTLAWITTARRVLGAAQRFSPQFQGHGGFVSLVGQEDQLRIKSTLAWVMLAPRGSYCLLWHGAKLIRSSAQGRRNRIQQGKGTSFFVFTVEKKVMKIWKGLWWNRLTQWHAQDVTIQLILSTF